MEIVKNNMIWNPGETIYEIDSKPDGIFIIVSGLVNIYSRDGLLLNSIGEKELLGETSTILNKKRSVTARAGPTGASAVYINKRNLENALRKNTALKAILEKTQLRLIDSNNQSEELSNLLSSMVKKINHGKTALNDIKDLVIVAKKKIASLVNSNLD
tara:strand:+ start:421 stop:894 length:474 start_codon:yes stop_codon:yes gene_type:complete